MTTHRRDRDRELTTGPGQAARPRDPASALQREPLPAEKVQSPAATVFQRATQAIRGAAQAAQTRLADIRARLLAVGRDLAAWARQAANARDAEAAALTGIKSVEEARTAMSAAQERRDEGDQVVSERSAAADSAALERQREVEAGAGIEAAMAARQALGKANTVQASATVTGDRVAEARKELRESMTEEQWAAYRKQRAGERRAEAQAKRDAAALAATPPDDRRRRATREDVREERVDGKKGKSKRKDKKKDLSSYRKVAERDARHEEIYRAAIQASYQEELDVVQGQSWQFPPEAVVEHTQTSKHHRLIGRSPLLEGVKPTPEALARALDAYAAKQSPGTKQKPVREAVISHPDGAEVTDEWLVFQACRHLAAMGIPPSSVPWVVTRHSEKDHQHAHLIWVPVEGDGTSYVCQRAVVASALETGRQDAWADVPAGRLRAPTSKLKDIRNGYFEAADGELVTFRFSPEGDRTEIPLQGPEAARFRLRMAGAPVDQHGHTGGTFTHKASTTSTLGKLKHNL